jgi:dGTPase
VEDVRLAGRTLIVFSPEVAAAERGLKQVLFAKVYRHDSVMEPVRRSEALVARLYDYYLETADMPGRWGVRAKSAEDDTARARVVSDFVAGMTDPYAIEQYTRLFDGSRLLG